MLIILRALSSVLDRPFSIQDEDITLRVSPVPLGRE